MVKSPRLCGRGDIWRSRASPGNRRINRCTVWCRSQPGRMRQGKGNAGQICTFKTREIVGGINQSSGSSLTTRVQNKDFHPGFWCQKARLIRLASSLKSFNIPSHLKWWCRWTLKWYLSETWGEIGEMWQKVGSNMSVRCEIFKVNSLSTKHTINLNR